MDQSVSVDKGEEVRKQGGCGVLEDVKKKVPRYTCSDQVAPEGKATISNC